MIIVTKKLMRNRKKEKINRKGFLLLLEDLDTEEGREVITTILMKLNK